AGALQSPVANGDHGASLAATMFEGGNDAEAGGAGTEQDDPGAGFGLAKVQATDADCDRPGPDGALKHQPVRTGGDRLAQNRIAYQQEVGKAAMFRVASANAVTPLHRVNHDALTDRDVLHRFTHLVYGACQFMPEGHWLRTRTPDVSIPGKVKVAATDA